MKEHIAEIVIAFAWLQTVAAFVSTFSKTMIHLRFASVLANICGVIVGLGSASLATFVRHLVILPIDIVRLREMRKLVASVKSASEKDLNVEWLKPFMHSRTVRDEEWLFRKGDEADRAFMLIEGEIEIPEINLVLKPGMLFGEMALFTHESKRTASAVCRSAGRVLQISYIEFEQLYFQNPEFGLYLVRLIVRRLQANMTQIEMKSSLAAEAGAS